MKILADTNNDSNMIMIVIIQYNDKVKEIKSNDNNDNGNSSIIL